VEKGSNGREEEVVGGAFICVLGREGGSVCVLSVYGEEVVWCWAWIGDHWVKGTYRHAARLRVVDYAE
jgi:hypothetical protein